MRCGGRERERSSDLHCEVVNCVCVYSFNCSMSSANHPWASKVITFSFFLKKNHTHIYTTTDSREKTNTKRKKTYYKSVERKEEEECKWFKIIFNFVFVCVYSKYKKSATNKSFYKIVFQNDEMKWIAQQKQKKSTITTTTTKFKAEKSSHTHSFIR